MKKSKKMSKARGSVKVFSIIRRKGKHRGEAKEVEIFMCTVVVVI
jgi:hypothetical protein